MAKSLTVLPSYKSVDDLTDAQKALIYAQILLRKGTPQTPEDSDKRYQYFFQGAISAPFLVLDSTRSDTKSTVGTNIGVLNLVLNFLQDPKAPDAAVNAMAGLQSLMDKENAKGTDSFLQFFYHKEGTDKTIMEFVIFQTLSWDVVSFEIRYIKVTAHYQTERILYAVVNDSRIDSECYQAKFSVTISPVTAYLKEHGKTALQEISDWILSANMANVSPSKELAMIPSRIPAKNLTQAQKATLYAQILITKRLPKNKVSDSQRFDYLSAETLKAPFLVLSKTTSDQKTVEKFQVGVLSAVIDILMNPEAFEVGLANLVVQMGLVMKAEQDDPGDDTSDKNPVVQFFFHTKEKMTTMEFCIFSIPDWSNPTFEIRYLKTVTDIVSARVLYSVAEHSRIDSELYVWKFNVLTDNVLAFMKSQPNAEEEVYAYYKEAATTK